MIGRLLVDSEERAETHDRLRQIAETLAAYDVKFVVIGGWAIDRAYPHIQYATRDIDFVIKNSEENYQKLAEALEELEVHQIKRGLVSPEPTYLNVDILRKREHWRFCSDLGDFDVMPSSGVISGYDVLFPNAREAQGTDHHFLIADPKLIYVSKHFASRPKDDRVLDDLWSAIIEDEGPEAGTAVKNMLAALDKAWKSAEDEDIEEMDRVFVSPLGDDPNNKLRNQIQEHTVEIPDMLPASLSPAKLSQDRCAAMLPRARVPCGRPKGHRGPHAR